MTFNFQLYIIETHAGFCINNFYRHYSIWSLEVSDAVFEILDLRTRPGKPDPKPDPTLGRVRSGRGKGYPVPGRVGFCRVPARV
jgi:hypothetical protein